MFLALSSSLTVGCLNVSTHPSHWYGYVFLSFLPIYFLSTFSTIVHRAFEADMTLVAVGRRLYVVSFREYSQSGSISLIDLQTTPGVYQIACEY